MSFGNRRESSIKSFVLSLQSSVSSKQPNMHVLQLLQCSKTIHKPIIHKSLHSSLPSPFNALSLPFAINHHFTLEIMFLMRNTYSFSISLLPHYTANKYYKHTYRNEQEGLTVNDTPSQMIGAPLTSLFSILSFYLVALSLTYGSRNHRSRPHPVSPCIGK